MRGALLGLLLALPLAAQNPRAGFYQWSGVDRPGVHLLEAARARLDRAGAGLIRLYLGPRFDYEKPVLSPERFEQLRYRTPRHIAGLPRYRHVLEDPALPTIVLTVYPGMDYGAGLDDVNLTRPFGGAARDAEILQIADLAEWLFTEFGGSAKTIILANTEADDRMLDIMNYSGSPRLAIENLIAWQNARYQAVDEVRRRHHRARLRLLSAFEISLVHLKIREAGGRFFKHPDGKWNALQDVVPQIRCDLVSYSAYESTNSPFETQNPDTDPAGVGLRLERDVRIIRELSGKPVMLGEVGFAYDRFDRLPSGGVAPRLASALAALRRLAPPYVVFWQAFDAPWEGREPVEWGWLDPRRTAPQPMLDFLRDFGIR